MSIVLGPTEIEDEFLPLTEVVSRAGVDVRTVRRRLRLAEVPLWPHPWDGRQRMVRREDLVRLFPPTQATAKSA